MKCLDYDDYRKYLRDIFEEKRAENAKYSYAYFSKSMGASEAYLKLVLAEKRHLNLDKAQVLTGKLRLSEVETSYLLTLIMRSQAKTAALRRYYENILLNYRSLALEYSPEKTRIAIFGDILTWEIFSLVGVDGFKPEGSWIKAKLGYEKASERRIDEIWQYLLKSGAVVKDGDHYRGKNIILKHEKYVDYAYIVSLERAIQYLEQPQSAKVEDANHFDAFCLIVSDQQMIEVKKILELTRNKIAAVVRRKEPKTRIAFLNLNLFPASY